MKERASFTNAVVKSAPAPIRNPRRDCSMKKPSEMSTHLEGLRPTVALASHIVVATVAGQGWLAGPSGPLRMQYNIHWLHSGCQGAFGMTLRRTRWAKGSSATSFLWTEHVA